MSKSVGLTHILTELSSLDDLGTLLKRSARLKYTCISASKRYLALGSNTGGVYIFSRDTLKYQQVVFADANSTPVTCIRLSPTNHHIAIAVSTGHVSVFELNIESRSKPELVRHTFDHVGHLVTALTWVMNGGKLYAGDECGKLSNISIPNKKGKALFAMPSEVIAFLYVAIYQIDWWDNKLLVSTLTNCYLFDTNRHNFSTIGSKKRDGEFGACIFLEPASLYPVIYCARPGSRIWEVDFEGKVLNTHQFKQLLAIPPVPVFNIMKDSYIPTEIEVQGGQSVTFNKMIPLGSLILTWNSKGLYLLDPINVKVIVWTDSYLGIRDIALWGNDAYLFLENSSVHRLTLLSIYPLFQLLASRARWSLMSCLLLSADQINLHASIIKRVRKDLFDSLLNGLKECGNNNMIEKLYGMMDDISESSINSVSLGDDFMGSYEEVLGHTTLPSGMVVVSEGFSLDPGVDARQEDDDMEKEQIKCAEVMGRKGENGLVTNKEGIEINQWREVDDRNNVEENNLHIDNGVNLDSSMVDKLGESVEQVRDGIQNAESQKEMYDETWETGALSSDSGAKNGHLDGKFEHLYQERDETMNIDEKTDILKSDNLLQENNDSKKCETDSTYSKYTINLLSDQISSVDNDTVMNQNTEKNSFLVETNSHQSLEDDNRVILDAASDSINPPGSSINSGLICNMINQSGQDESTSISSTENCCGEHVVDVPILPVNGLKNETSEHSVLEKNNLHKNHEENVLASQQTELNSSHQSDLISSQESMSEQVDCPSMASTSSSKGRFSNFHIKNEDTGVIAQAVKKPKKKKKKQSPADHPEKNMSDSSRKTVILRSSSCGDLVQESLYQHNEKEGDTVSISTISSIEEDEAKEEPFSTNSSSLSPFIQEKEACDSSSPYLRRKLSYDTMSLSEEHEITHLQRSSIHSLYGESFKAQVIPPLIDRLAAAKGGERPTFPHDGLSSSSNSSLTESGEFSALMSQLPSSLSAMKDGLSLKLKTQTRHFIKSFKEKNPLKEKSPTSPLLHPSAVGKSTIKDPTVTSNQSQERAHHVDTTTELSLEEEAACIVKDQLDSLYNKAVRIQTAVKTSNLAMQPLAFKALLNEWCQELNTIMHRFLEEVRHRKEKRGDNSDGLKSESLSHEGWKREDEREENKDKVEMVEGVDIQYAGDTCILNKDNGSCTNTSSNENAHLSCDQSVTSNSNAILTSHGQDPYSNSYSSQHSIEESSAFPISQILHVYDPFHLNPNQRQAFHDLCTLCFLSGVTGNILSIFESSQEITQISVIKSYLPTHMQSSFTSNTQEDFLTSLVQKVLSKNINSVNCPCQLFSHDNKLSTEGSSSINRLMLCSQHCKKQNCSDNEYSREGGTANGTNESGELDNQIVIGEGKPFTDRMVEDLELAVFLRVFFFLLDYNLIKQEMNRWCCSKFLTWVSFITCCHQKGKNDIVNSLVSDKQTNAAIDYLRSGILLHPSSLIGHLHRLFQYTPAKTAEFCSEIPTSITIQEVIALCLMADKSPTVPMLRYFKKYVIDFPFHQRASEFGKLCAIPVVRLLLLSGLLPSRRQDYGKEIAGKEVQGLAANVISILPHDWLEQILSQVTSFEEQNLILHLCLNLRQWKPCVHLMSQWEDRQSLIQLLVTVGDMDLIAKDGYLPQTMDEWRMLLSCFLHTQNSKHKTTTDSISGVDFDGVEKNDSLQAANHINGNELEENKDVDFIIRKNKQNNDDDVKKDEENTSHISCNTHGDNVQNKIDDSSMMRNKSSAAITEQKVNYMFDGPPAKSPMTWESLTNLLVQHIGGAKTVEMLCQYLCCTGSLTTDQVPLTPNLLQACLTDFKVQEEQNQLCHEMLERLSVYMWAKKPGFLPPSVCHVVKSENSNKGGVPKALEEDLTCHRQLNLLQSTSSGLLMSENLGTHWGQELYLKQTCQTCQMPLRQIVSHDLPGVVLFSCGDAFHKKCCQGSFCPILH